MNTTTEQTAKQLRLAADILETGHPWEHSDASSRWVSVTNEDAHPLKVLADGRKIRLTLATPPDGRPLHNPDNLTAEQVGAGWRLLLEDERMQQEHELWLDNTRGWCKTLQGGDTAEEYDHTYRVPLSTPWPDPKPDPYAALKQAHKEGKVIQVQVTPLVWEDRPEPSWSESPDCYRIKPSTPPFQLPPPPPGRAWHREDGWTAEMLKKGERPLVKGEAYQKGDLYGNGHCWHAIDGLAETIVDKWTDGDFSKTTRPLTFTHCGQTWTYHRLGDPMPCDGESNIYCVGGRLVSEHPRPAAQWFWNEKGEQEIIGWRYTDEPKPQVPLGPEDVLPGSIIRGPADGTEVWAAVITVVSRGISITNGRFISYKPLKEGGWIINRSLPLTGKWNPDAWEPCHKPG